MCAKLRTAAASKNRDYTPRSLCFCLFAPHIYGCYSSRTSRSWWIAHSTQRQPRGCNNTDSTLQISCEVTSIGPGSSLSLFLLLGTPGIRVPGLQVFVQRQFVACWVLARQILICKSYRWRDILGWRRTPGCFAWFAGSQRGVSALNKLNRFVCKKRYVPQWDFPRNEVSFAVLSQSNKKSCVFARGTSEKQLL